MKAILKVHSNENTIEHALNQGESACIGRSGQSDIQVGDIKVSGRHCRLNFKKDRLEIIDLDSKNGTYLNGIRIEQSEMFMGDEIKIGDTCIILEESKMAIDAVNALTFPGQFKDRISHELKADFTGARIQNQLNNRMSLSDQSESPSHEKEIILRKKIKSRLKLSKQEIRVRNKILSFFTSFLDSILVFCALLLPLTFVGKILPVDIQKHQKIMILLFLMGLSCITFIILNFKTAKFTLGERILGIKKLYLNQ